MKTIYALALTALCAATAAAQDFKFDYWES